ncbi:MAG: DUF1007 family protein [Desulfobacterales bacterium]|nr:DUF1007 family protein [Desulfobacterales bacterium]
MKFSVSVLSIFLLFSLPGKALSHPHVFIYNSIKVVFDKKGLVGFRVKWVFDEMFSNMLIYDFDKNGNGSFEPSEIRDIKNGAFSNLKNFDYFTHIMINGKPFKVKFVKDFSAKIKGDALTYRFFVPCHVLALSTFKEIKISIYDISFYCSVFLTKKPIDFENASPYEFHYRIGKNKKEAYYYGQVYPEDITLRFRLKNG